MKPSPEKSAKPVSVSVDLPLDIRLKLETISRNRQEKPEETAFYLCRRGLRDLEHHKGKAAILLTKV